MSLRYLFVDFNSYFASVEQLDEAALRGRPVAVVPVDSEGTCCIAASYQAKAFGVKTGTSVAEARQRCPEIVFRLARPARYVALHHELMELIGSCIPHETPASIDEVACPLLANERSVEAATAIARQIKQALHQRCGNALTCSIGIAPNRFLAKTAADMQKPDGLTVLQAGDLPSALHRLELDALCGIGPSMLRRLHAAGISRTDQLCAASPRQLRAIWGGIGGERFWADLHGIDTPLRTTQTQSIGHSHVLGPELRSITGASAVAAKLLAKAAMRLRRGGWLATSLHLNVRLTGREERLETGCRFAGLDDSRQLLQLLRQLLEPLPGLVRGRCQPLSVSVTLGGLCQAAETVPDLFQNGRQQRQRALNQVLDAINQRYGHNTLYFGAAQPAVAAGAAPMRIPFSVIPDVAAEDEASAHPLWQQAHNHFNVVAEARHRQRRLDATGPVAEGLPSTNARLLP